MAIVQDDFQPWDDVDRQLGQLFMMGFDGTTVNDQIKSLIRDHHVGSVLLTAKNLQSAEQAVQLILDLQNIAREAGHPVPLHIAVDQENGGVNSLFDEQHVRQFPSAMGVAATGSTQLAKEVAKATALELRAVGINWILGPVLDVLTNAKSQPLGVRTPGEDPQEVTAYGVEFLKGYHEAGLSTCGKHFPSYGNIELWGAETDVPIITESLEQLSQRALVPFQNAISHGLDAVIVGGVAVASNDLHTMHACLSAQVVQDLLRNKMSFNGVVVSDCLETNTLRQNIGIANGTVMAAKAGCDVILLCSSYPAQREAINAFKFGVQDGSIDSDQVQQSLGRVVQMKSRCTSWERALSPAGVTYLNQVQQIHSNLSTTAYNGSITVIRDEKQVIPLSQSLLEDQDLLILTPLLNPLPASAAYHNRPDANDGLDTLASWEVNTSIMSGERVFREFGRTMSRKRRGRVLHTSYTANGLRPMHEDLIERAGAVLVVTANAGRNLYQNGFAKHVSMICRSSPASNGHGMDKSCVVVSVSSPYDFAFEKSIGTYICTYDFTETALQALARVLLGDLQPAGVLPGVSNGVPKLHQAAQHWLVEHWNEERDMYSLQSLLQAAREHRSPSQQSILSGVSPKTFLMRHAGVEEAHFVVRNSSTKEIYGFCASYHFKSTGVGVIGAIIVDPAMRNRSIGHSLHNRALRSLMETKGVKKMQLGCRIPSLYLGIPTDDPVEALQLRQWFANLGWNMSTSQMYCSLILRNLPMWTPPEGLGHTLSDPDVKFDLVYGSDYAEVVFEHVNRHAQTGVAETYLLALADKSNCAIIRAKRPDSGHMLGSLVLFKNNSKLASFVPALADTRVLAGGISSPVISPLVADPLSLLQGLVLLGIRQIKKQGASTVVLDCIEKGSQIDNLCAMGLGVFHTFEELTSDRATWALTGTS